MAAGSTLGAVFGVGNPTESIFQLMIADRAEGVTGTGQHPDSAATLEKSFPPPSAFPFEINILQIGPECPFATDQPAPVTVQFKFTARWPVQGDLVDFLDKLKLIDCKHYTEWLRCYLSGQRWARYSSGLAIPAHTIGRLNPPVLCPLHLLTFQLTLRLRPEREGLPRPAEIRGRPTANRSLITGMDLSTYYRLLRTRYGYAEVLSL